MPLKRSPLDYMYDTSVFLGRGGVSRVITDRATAAGGNDARSTGNTTRTRRAPISMGPPIDRRDIKIPAGTGLSEISSVIARQIQAQIAQATNGQRTILNKEVIPVAVQMPPPPPVRSSPVPTGAGLLPKTTTNTTNDKGKVPMALDLGSLIGNVAGQYFDARFAPQPQGVAYGPSITPPVTMQALGVPFVDVIPEASTKNQVWDPRANCGQGKWIRRNKRRRRRLATATDIADLAALKPVTTGSQMNTWIATHPT